MTNCSTSPALYQSQLFRKIVGNALRPGGLELTARALDLCAFPPGARLLDAGCGPGATLELLCNAGFSAVGLELRADFAAEAARHGPVLRSDLTATLPLADASFSGILCECVLSLFDDKAVILKEFTRLLRPGGRLILTDPLTAGPDAAGPCGCAAGAVSPATMDALLRAAGLTLLHCEDHSRRLRELAAYMTWHSGSVTDFLREAGMPGCPRPGAGSLAYYLIIAEKQEEA